MGSYFTPYRITVSPSIVAYCPTRFEHRRIPLEHLCISANIIECRLIFFRGAKHCCLKNYMHGLHTGGARPIQPGGGSSTRSVAENLLPSAISICAIRYSSVATFGESRFFVISSPWLLKPIRTKAGYSWRGPESKNDTSFFLVRGTC